jgi:hypothetical protein
MFKHGLELQLLVLGANFNIHFIYYQQSGDAKNPYFVQYSADVSEGPPVITSWTNRKINILIKNILKPLNTHFNTFLIELFSAKSDNIITYMFFFYIIIIKHAVSEMRMQNLLESFRHLIIVIFSFSFILI